MPHRNWGLTALLLVLAACGGAKTSTPVAAAPAPEVVGPSWNDSVVRRTIGTVLRTEFGRLPATRRAMTLGCELTACRGVDSVAPQVARALRLRVVSRPDSLFDAVGRRKATPGASTLLPDCGRNLPTWGLASLALVPRSDTAPERLRVDVYKFNARAWCTGTIVSTWLERTTGGSVRTAGRQAAETTLESR